MAPTFSTIEHWQHYLPSSSAQLDGKLENCIWLHYERLLAVTQLLQTLQCRRAHEGLGTLPPYANPLKITN